LNAGGKNFILVFFTTRRNKRPNLPQPTAPLFRPEFFPPKKRLNAGGKNFILVFFHNPTQQKTEPSPAGRAAFPPGIFLPPKKD